MHFDKIKFDGSRVELEYKEELPAGGERDVQDHGKDPSPKFKTALQAFTSFVLWVHSFPADMADRIEIRGVTIKRPDDAPRGIVVTALLKCPHARNSTSTLNTPYVAEPPDGYNGEMNGLLSLAVRDFIDTLEHEAELYQAGERGEQITLALGVSENSKAFADRSAAAETRTTRRGKKPDGPAQVPGVGLVMNPNAVIEDITDDMVRQLLLTVERDVPIDAIARWTSSERSASIVWAKMQQKKLTSSLKPLEEMPAEPVVIKASATMPLGIASSKPAATPTPRTVQ